jgi:hypothetical protein
MADDATLLRDHVTLECRSIDRIFLQAYVPKLQSVGQVCIFLRWRRKYRIPSSAAFGKIGDGYLKTIHEYAKRNQIPVVHFQKGQNKEEVARPYLEAAAREGKDRVVLIGIAQEKASVRRSWPRKGQEKTAHPHMDWGREMAYINHFYFYLWDCEWGGAFWKTNAYAPFPIWLWLNGHEWAKRFEKARIAYHTRRWTTGSVPVPIPPRYKKFAIAWAQVRSRASFGDGFVACLPRSPTTTCEPATFTSWRSANLRSPTRAYSNGRRRVGCGSRA